jgi:hypothetical protein
MINSSAVRLSRNVVLISVLCFLQTPFAQAAITGGYWGCNEWELDGVAYCGAFGQCDSGDVDAAVYSAAWADMSCDNQPVENYASSYGAIGGQQVSSNSGGISLWGNFLGQMVSNSDFCSTGSGGYTYQSLNPDGCNPPAPPQPGCIDPNDACYGQDACCGEGWYQ